MSLDIDRLQKSTRKVQKFLQKHSKRPGSHAVHEVRTNSSRLATIFLALGLDSTGRVKRVLSNLEVIRKRAGKVRDVDVLTAAAMSVKHDGEEDCQVQLLEHLGAQRDKHARKLRRAIRKTDPQLRRELKRASRRAKKIVQKALNDPADSNALSLAVAKSVQLSSQLNRPVRLNRNNLHRYRLRVKELLDVLKLASRPTDPEFLNKLVQVKNAIGEWHDWEQLAAVAREINDHASSCKLIKDLETNKDARYVRALSLANDLRNDYFQDDEQKGVLLQPVLKAAAAIAQ